MKKSEFKEAVTLIRAANKYGVKASNNLLSVSAKQVALAIHNIRSMYGKRYYSKKYNLVSYEPRRAPLKRRLNGVPRMYGS